MPINTNTGKIKTANHHKYLLRQKIREEALLENKSFNCIECPELSDILFGRGWPKMGHPGNAAFRNTLESRLEEYNAIKSKREKTLVTLSIVNEFKECGARFLKEENSGFWVEVSNNVARQKVSIGFRDVRKARQKLYASLKAGQAAVPAASKPEPSSKRKVPSKDKGDSSEEDTSRGYNFFEGGKRHRSLCSGSLCSDNENCF